MRDLPFLANVETFFTLITMEIEWTLFSLRLSSLLLCVCLRFAFSYMHSHFISRFVFVYSSIHSFVFFEFSPPICARSTPIWQHLRSDLTQCWAAVCCNTHTANLLVRSSFCVHHRRHRTLQNLCIWRSGFLDCTHFFCALSLIFSLSFHFLPFIRWFFSLAFYSSALIRAWTIVYALAMMIMLLFLVFLCTAVN